MVHSTFETAIKADTSMLEMASRSTQLQMVPDTTDMTTKGIHATEQRSHRARNESHPENMTRTPQDAPIRLRSRNTNRVSPSTMASNEANICMTTVITHAQIFPIPIIAITAFKTKALFGTTKKHTGWSTSQRERKWV